MGRHPRRRPGRRGDLRPGPAAAGRQQAVRLAEHEGPVAAAGHRRLRVLRLRLRLLPHHHDHDRGNKIYYYRCLGSDDYRYPGGRVCQNKPVRADYADQVVWDHVAALLADPALIRAEIGKRLERARTSDPVTRKRGQLEQALAKTGKSIAAMITAFSEQLAFPHHGSAAPAQALTSQASVSALLVAVN
jgi:hypothetical protein